MLFINYQVVVTISEQAYTSQSSFDPLWTTVFGRPKTPDALMRSDQAPEMTVETRLALAYTSTLTFDTTVETRLLCVLTLSRDQTRTCVH